MSRWSSTTAPTPSAALRARRTPSTRILNRQRSSSKENEPAAEVQPFAWRSVRNYVNRKRNGKGNEAGGGPGRAPAKKTRTTPRDRDAGRDPQCCYRGICRARIRSSEHSRYRRPARPATSADHLSLSQQGHSVAAAAEHAFAQIRTEWDILATEGSDLSPLARLRQEYTALFRYTVAFPEFHRFMRQEALMNSPRLKWVAETVLAPLLARLLPQIIEAQERGLLPAVNPILFHYMMISLTAALSEFGPEMQVASGLSSEDTKVVEAYWRLVDETVFGLEPKTDRARARTR